MSESDMLGTIIISEINHYNIVCILYCTNIWCRDGAWSRGSVSLLRLWITDNELIKSIHFLLLKYILSIWLYLFEIRSEELTFTYHVSCKVVSLFRNLRWCFFFDKILLTISVWFPIPLVSQMFNKSTCNNTHNH